MDEDRTRIIIREIELPDGDRLTDGTTIGVSLEELLAHVPDYDEEAFQLDDELPTLTETPVVQPVSAAAKRADTVPIVRGPDDSGAIAEVMDWLQMCPRWVASGEQVIARMEALGFDYLRRGRDVAAGIQNAKAALLAAIALDRPLIRA